MDSRIIWFAGKRLSPNDGNDPVVIRGYDSAGNLLSAIRFAAADGFPDAIAGDIKGHVYVGMRDNLTEHFRKYRRNGDRIPFPNLHGARIRAMALDSGGNIIVGGDESGAEKYILRKYTSEGALLWSAPASTVEFIDQSEPFPPTYPSADKVLALQIASNGDIVTVGGKINGGGLVRRYDGATGALLWTSRPAGVPDSLAIDDDGNIYTAGIGCSGYFFTDEYFMPYGALIRRGNYNWSPTAVIQIDSDPYNYGYHSIYKWAADGAFIAAANPWREISYDANSTSLILHNDVLHVISDQTDQVADYSTPFANYKTYDLDLTELGASVLNLSNRIEVDPVTTYSVKVNDRLSIATTGERYMPGNRDKVLVSSVVDIPDPWGTMTITVEAIYHFQAFDTDGVTRLWDEKNASGAPGVDYLGRRWDEQQMLQSGYPDVYYTTYTQGCSDLYDSLPGGPDFMTYSGRAPFQDFWDCRLVYVVDGVENPALALGLSLGAADYQGDRYIIAPGLALALALSIPETLRDFLGRVPYQTIYRLFLTGSPNLELPLSSISCRRNSGGMSLSVVCPGVTATQMSGILARSAGTLTVKRGARFINGDEQLEEFLVVPLESIAHDTGANSASVTLSGSLPWSAETIRTRLIRGISYRAGDGSSNRIRSEIDTFLRVGDIADLGNGEIITVDEMVYWIGPNQATMEIVGA